MTATGEHLAVPGEPSRRAIGRAGTAARIIVGASLLGIVLQGELGGGGLSPRSMAVGLVGIPALVVGLQWLRARRMPIRLAATRPWDFALNMGGGRGALPDAVLALSNWLLRRNDHVGCAFFAPIDYLERRLRPAFR